MVILCLLPGLAASGSDHAKGAPARLPGENFILAWMTNHVWIDMASNSTGNASSMITNRTISGEFLKSLLTGEIPLSHDGLRLKNAIIESTADVSYLEVAVPAWFVSCRFKNRVNLSEAHFDYDLTFSGCSFEEEVTASGLRVDGSLAFKTCELKPPVEMASTNTPPQLGDFVRFFGASQMLKPWLTEHGGLVPDTNRLIHRWHIYDPRANGWTNIFMATAWGEELFIVENYDHVQEQVSNNIVGLTFGPLMSWKDTNGSLNLEMVRAEFANALQTNLSYVQTNVLTTNATITPDYVSWTFDPPQDFNASPIIAVWQPGGSHICFYQHTVFGRTARFDRATLGGKLDGGEAEFKGELYARSLKVEDDLVMNSVRLDGPANFSLAHIEHDFCVSDSLFQSFDASGMSVGGSLLAENVRFRNQATFANVAVSMQFRGHNTRFENGDAAADFSGLDVSGFVDFQRAQFKGPASFILAHIKGDFQMPGATFENARDVDYLARHTVNNSTFNADFGSMQVEGFAVLENVQFARSVSFRNARFSNLYLDGTHWAAAHVLSTYTGDPGRTNFLRVESMDFQTIRNVAASHFVHNQAQLEESKTKLMGMLARYSPYSFDIYDKLQGYFERAGAPDLANDVYIAAKKREGREANWWLASLGNKFLFVTIGYGRQPWKAFCLSLAVVLLCWPLYKFHMKVKEADDDQKIPANKKPDKDAPGWWLSLFYSLGIFLPIINLGTDDLLEIKEDKTQMRYLIAAEQIFGFILVPLWTIALSGLIK